MSEASVVEAVIISGSRRGEIVHVDLEKQEVWDDQELDQIANALGHLDAALVSLLHETRGLKEDLRAFRAEV